MRVEMQLLSVSSSDGVLLVGQKSPHSVRAFAMALSSFAWYSLSPGLPKSLKPTVSSTCLVLPVFKRSCMVFSMSCMYRSTRPKFFERSMNCSHACMMTLFCVRCGCWGLGF